MSMEGRLLGFLWQRHKFELISEYGFLGCVSSIVFEV